MLTNTNSATERLIKDAGISPGMRVLDIGCGNGEVSLLLAKVVGPGGEVVGIDRNEKAIDVARDRVKSQNMSHVTFHKSNLDEPMPDLGMFDAAIGRRVLMYLPNPVDTICYISANLKPNGVIVFQETDSTLVPGRVESFPLHDKVNNWIWHTVEREGANIHMGFNLPSVLEKAGFTIESIRAEAIIQGHHPDFPPLATIVRGMLPRIIQHNVATEAEIDIETLEQRLKDERPANSVYVSSLSFRVWARKSQKK